MKTPTPKAPPNYDLIEITKVSQVEPKGCGLVVFYKGMYDLDGTVSNMWGDRRAVVYWMTHKYKNRESVCYYIPMPRGKING